MSRLLDARIAIGIAVFVSLCIIFGAVALARAQEDTIVFPIAELGGCKDKKSCHAYCDDLAHVKECVDFAESHGLMSADEARQARAVGNAGGKGPGGCSSKSECESYCEDTSHMRQCLDFAKRTNLMSPQEIEEAEKVASYLESGGSTPGDCRGENECRTYCEEDAHMEECAEFALKAGFMSEREAAMFRKTGGKGPGGCRGRACEAFCQDEKNREQCIEFAIEHDLMSDEDKERMQEGMQKAKQAIEKAPPGVLSCIEAALGSGAIEKVRSGEGFSSPRFGEVLPRCFREVMGGGDRGPFGPGSAARECMRKVFGDDFEEKMRNGELNPGARDNEIRTCMQEAMGEGYLTDDGKWQRPENGGPMPGGESGGVPEQSGSGRFGPPPGVDHDTFEAQMRERYGDEFEAKRAEMEAQMREEIERQMQNGTFDPSRLPADFRPEGAFPPPGAHNRPPDGSGMLPPDALMPPDGSMPPPGASIPTETRAEPMSLQNPYVASMLTAFMMLLGLR